MKICTDMSVPQRMDPPEFGDALTLPLLQPTGHHFFYFCSEIYQQLRHGLDQNLTQMTYPNDFSDLLTSPLGIRPGFVTSGICGNLKRKIS